MTAAVGRTGAKDVIVTEDMTVTRVAEVKSAPPYHAVDIKNNVRKEGKEGEKGRAARGRHESGLPHRGWFPLVGLVAGIMVRLQLLSSHA